MQSDIRAITQQNRDLIILIWLISLILAIPTLESTPWGELILVLLVTALLISALYAVSDRPIQVAAGILLTIPALLCSWTYAVVQSEEILIALLLTLSVFLIFIIFVVLQKVFMAREVTLIELFRAIEIYLMIGLTFGLLYLIMEMLSPYSFQFASGNRDPEALIYFSFVALSTSGFGDITAVAPGARSLVTAELLIGVMYMAMLIGFLVNAHYSSRYSRPRPEWKEEGTGLIRRFRVPILSSGGPITLMAIAVMLNMATSIVIVASGVPLFMDTWGTSFAVIMSGFPAGALAGILYNTIMAFTIWEPSALVFAGNSVLVAALTWFFWKRGWVDVRAPMRLVVSGLLTGVASALLATMLYISFSIPVSESTISLYRHFIMIFSDSPWSLLLMEMLVEMIDKTFSIILAAVAAVFFTAFFEREKEKQHRENNAGKEN